MADKKIQSVEPKVADTVNNWLKNYNLDYKLEQESLNDSIDKALQEYYSKTGGKGGNRPDAKLLLQDENLNYYPVLIEYKGYKNKLVKLDKEGQIENQKNNKEPHYSNIQNYAVNGAVHYANAILHYTQYDKIFAIGITGYEKNKGKLELEIGVYYVAKENFGMGQKIGDYTDLSFLKKENFEEFINHVKNLSLSEKERNYLKEQREEEIMASLTKLNNDIYKNEQGLSEKDRVYLVVATVMATLGIPEKVPPLAKEELISQNYNSDGSIIMLRVTRFLEEKNLPPDKLTSVLRVLQNTLLSKNINKIVDGETQAKRMFCKIYDDLGIYYKIGINTDFTGMLFNEMYRWLPWTQDTLNDVVLTPPYVAKLLVKLCRTNKDSYVWDNATGSAGLLIAAMHEMINDAKKTIKSPEEFRKKAAYIRAEQLLGLEILQEIYVLAVLNMILMGDGSSKILNEDSLSYFEDNEENDETKNSVLEKFNPTVFVLNPPYSKDGNGMIFVKTALEKMKSGYAAVIIQDSAGSGKARVFNIEILKRNTLEARIKMPNDLFIGKSNVQTSIYVFKVGEPHNKKSLVKFIDFSNDGYTRTNRKKARINLRDTDHAKERYEEVVNLVKFGKQELKYLNEKDYYEGYIDPKNGADWNQTAPIDRRPKLEDFKKVVSDYLSWEVSNILKEREENSSKK